MLQYYMTLVFICLKLPKCMYIVRIDRQINLYYFSRVGGDLVPSTSGLQEMGGVMVTPVPQMVTLRVSTPLLSAR